MQCVVRAKEPALRQVLTEQGNWEISALIDYSVVRVLVSYVRNIRRYGDVSMC